MVQVKKDDVQQRIVAAAEELFSDRGYAGTTVAAIAKASGVSKSNIYVYFASKLEILWAISNPWLRARFDNLENELAARETARDKTRHLFVSLWCDLPADRNGFANNMMQALTTSSETEGYSAELLRYCEARFAELLGQALGAVPMEATTLSRISFMAFDGFAIGHRLGESSKDARSAAIAFADMLCERYGL